MNIFWIWFAGAVVWWIDAALAVHFGSLSHALFAILIAMLFMIGAMYLPKRQKTHQ